MDDYAKAVLVGGDFNGSKFSVLPDVRVVTIKNDSSFLAVNRGAKNEVEYIWRGEFYQGLRVYSCMG